MLVVEDLLNREAVAHRVVECSGDHASVGITADYGSGEGPAVAVDTARILSDGAEHVCAVLIADVTTEAGGIFAGISRVVGRTVERAEAVGSGVHAEGGRAAAESGRGHTAQRAVRELAAHRVGEVDTVDVAGRPLVVETAVLVVDHAEVVVRGLIEDVVGSTLDGAHALGETFVFIDLFFVEYEFVRVISLEESRFLHLDVAHVVGDARKDMHVDESFGVAVGHDLKHIFAGGGVRDYERTIGRGGHEDGLVAKHYVRIGDRLAGHRVDHRTLEAGFGQHGKRHA